MPRFIKDNSLLMSFVAMFLMAQKRIESWVYWIIVDAIGIVLYHTKNVQFVALLYVVLLLIAISGLLSWIRSYNKAGES